VQNFNFASGAKEAGVTISELSCLASFLTSNNVLDPQTHFMCKEWRLSSIENVDIVMISRWFCTISFSLSVSVPLHEIRELGAVRLAQVTQ
jgi:hypothetical protein